MSWNADEPARWRFGQMISVKYGEPFLVKELLKVDDVVEMDVRSI